MTAYNPERVRPGAAPELVSSRNFEGLKPILAEYKRSIESHEGLLESLVKKVRGLASPSIARMYTSTTTSATLTPYTQSVFADATAGNIILTPPTASTCPGVRYLVFKTDATNNTVTIFGNVLGANGARSRIALVSDGSTWRLEMVYEEGSYTATLTGCATSPTIPVYFVKNGKAIFLKVLSPLQAISNTNAATITGMPSFLYPPSDTDIQLPSVRDNGLSYNGLATISTAGVMTLVFQNSISSRTATFTNSGTKGVGAFSAEYLMFG